MRQSPASPGRFLQTDPVAGGSASACDYCNADPVNCSGLDGEWPSWKSVLKAVALAGEIASMVPGRVGAGVRSVPHVGASEESLAAAAQRLGRPLDDQRAALLAMANGWELAFLSGNVLSTDELGQGRLWAEAQQALDAFYAEGDSAGWTPRDHLIPVHASPYDTDVMALWTEGPVTEGGHPILYFSGEIVDRWPNVYEWWLGMLLLQERSLAHVLKLIGQTPS